MLIGNISPENLIPAKPGIIYWDKALKIQYVKEEGPDTEPYSTTGWHEQYAAANAGGE